jgi:hypothetical protein
MDCQMGDTSSMLEADMNPSSWNWMCLCKGVHHRVRVEGWEGVMVMGRSIFAITVGNTMAHTFVFFPRPAEGGDCSLF